MICFLFGILLGVLTVNGIEDHALVGQQEELSSKELKRVKRFIQENNPQKLKSGETASTQISQQDLNLAMNYISQKAPGSFKSRLSSNVILDEKQAYVQMSFHLPNNPIGRYINIAAIFESEKSNQNSEVVKLKSLSLGSLDLPAIIAKPLSEYIHKMLQGNIAEYKQLSQSLQSISFARQQLTVN